MNRVLRPHADAFDEEQDDDEKNQPTMIPLLTTIRSYDRSWLTPDIRAAATVWAIVVPESMAYASIAGMPPETGLYAASVPLIGYALFASSRRITYGPSAAIAAISAATVVPLVGSGDGEAVFAMTTALTILTGLILLVAGLAKLGAIADFLSTPVLKGFLTGVGLTVAIGQVPKILGTDVDGDGFFEQLIGVFRALPDADIPTVFLGLAVLALLFALERWAPKAPSALVAVVVSIAAVSLFDLQDRGIAVVGEIASGFPLPSIPDVSFTDVISLFGGAIGLAVVIFGQTAALAKAFALPHGEDVDGNLEMKASGVANIAGGIFGTFATSGSDSRTAAANTAGQRSQLSTVIVAAMVLVTALFLTGLFQNLPEAVLGAIVIHAVSGLIELEPFRRLARLNRSDFWAAIATLLGVLVFEVLAGLLIGIFVSLGLLMAKVVRPRVVELGRDPDSGAYVGLEQSGTQPVPGITVLRFDANLFFANVGLLQSEVRNAAGEAAGVVVDMDPVDDIDTTATDAVRALIESLDETGVTLVFARVHETVRVQLEQSGIDLSDRVHPRVSDAIKWLQNRAGGHEHAND